MTIRPIDDANIVTPRGSVVAPNFQTYVSGGIFAGPLLKAQYTNQLLFSEDLTNAAWTKSGFSTTAQQAIAGQQFTEATRLTTTTTSGLCFQSMPSSAMVTGGCYQMTAWMRLISGNANVQFGVGGQFIQKVSGVVLTSSWQQVNIYTLVGRDATQTIPNERASGNIYGAYFYIPSGAVVEISAVQLTLGNFVEPYVKTTSTYGRVAPRYETGCIYVARRERNYLQESNLNNITSYWISSMSGAGAGTTNSTSNENSPIGAKSITRLRNNNTVAGGRGVIKNMALGSGQDLQKPFQMVATVKSEHVNGAVLDYSSASSQNGMYYSTDSIDGVVTFLSCSGKISDLGDGWKTISTIPGATAGPMNLASATAFNLSPRILMMRDSFQQYFNSFSNSPDDLYVANFQILDTYHTPSFFVTGASSGEVSGDIVTIGPSVLWDYNQGTFLIDFYVDEYFGIGGTGADRYIRTILDCAEQENRNRIRFFKDLASHSYGAQVINQFGVSASGGFNLTLPIGWHRAQIDFTQSAITVHIDGTQRLTLPYSGGRNAGSVINVGSNRFNTWENYGGYLKNLHVFDEVVSNTFSSNSYTNFNTYRSSESITNSESVFTTAYENPINWNNISGGTQTTSGNIVDPFGGTGAYRYRRVGGGISKSTFLGKTNFFRQGVSYTHSAWIRLVTSTASTASFFINGLANIPLATASTSWTRYSATSSVAAGANVGGVAQMLIQTNDGTTGSVLEFEVFKPEVVMSWTRSRDVFSPNQEVNIPMTTQGLRFKHRLGSEFGYGIVGTWESEAIDVGSPRQFIATDISSTTPGTSLITYQYAASNSESGPFNFTPLLSSISGRYAKVMATVYVDDVSQGFPTIDSVKLIPRSKIS